MAVGFWNFVGAGVFDFLINLPIVSYFEVVGVVTLVLAVAILLRGAAERGQYEGVKP